MALKRPQESRNGLAESMDQESQQNSEQSVNRACKILIVEDTEKATDIRDTFIDPSDEGKKLTANYGVPKFDDNQVRIAVTYDQALQELDAACALVDKQIDLVLLDLYIPNAQGKPDRQELLGFTILEKIRGVYEHKLGYHLPVVILSANVSTTTEDSYGFDYFKKLLKQRNSIALPDEILSKEKEGAHPGYLDSLQLLRKTAKYLVDLDPNDTSLLESERVRIFLMKNSVSWRVLRQLKRIARSSEPGQPLPDVLLLGENGVGKSTFARAYDVLRRTPEDGRVGFMSEDLGTLDMQGGSAPSLRLFGSTGWYEFKDDPSAWTLGSFSRATAYKQGNKRLRFVTQEFRQGNGELQENREARQVNEPLYPTEDYVPDYDASATLFLDEVVNISDEMQAMLLQALGYDRERRHVFTTGRVSRRVPVGPAIVMATRKDIDEMARKDDGVSLALRDYLYRIDQVRVRIPPLRERKSEIIPFLKRAVGNRRQKTRPEISVDPRVEHVLMHDLRYDNNFADLERIADQVQAEEETITFSHVRALYEREVLKDLREEIGQKLMTVEGCIEYLEKVEKEKIPQSITDLQNNPNFSPSMVYRIGCSLFIHKLDAKAAEWPNNEQTMAYFGENKGGFKASLSRLGDRIWSADPNLSEEDRKALAGLGGVQRQIEIMVSEQATRTGRTASQASPTEKATKSTRRRSTRVNGSSAGV